MSRTPRLPALALLTLILFPCSGHAADDGLAPMAFLVGDWTGVSEGEPGVAATTRHVERAHGDHYIVVEGRSVYPKQEKNESGEVHTSTDFWSFDRQRQLIVLRQFDNLGFVSTYVQDAAASREGHIVFVSEHLENVPPTLTARYTFDVTGPDAYHELFELNEDGQGFKPYVSGNFLRAQP